MPSPSIFNIGQTSISWSITGLSSDWNSTNYSYVYITIDGEGTSAPVYPPLTGTSRTSGTGSFSGLTAGTNYNVSGFAVTPSGGTFSAGSTSFTTDSPPVTPEPSPLTGLSATAVSTSQINASWSASTNATRYRVFVTPNPPSGIYDVFTASTSISVTGLASGTTYSVWVYPYNVDTVGSGAVIGGVTTHSARPTNFAWTNSKISGGNINVSKAEWDSFKSRITAFRSYKSLSTISFTVISVGTDISASICNQVRNAINDMSPPTAVPSTVTAGSTVISASYFNGLVSSLNSIP